MFRTLTIMMVAMVVSTSAIATPHKEVFKSKNIHLVCDKTFTTDAIMSELKHGGKIRKINDYYPFEYSIHITDRHGNMVHYDLVECLKIKNRKNKG